MPHSRILIHIVFGTKKRIPTIPMDKRDLIFGYVRKIFENEFKSKLLKINGITDHFHLLIDLNPTEQLASIMQLIKQSTSRWLGEDEKFPEFQGWGKGYFASSVSPINEKICIKYIENQESHHKNKIYKEELKSLVISSRLKWYDDDLE